MNDEKGQNLFNCKYTHQPWSLTTDYVKVCPELNETFPNLLLPTLNLLNLDQN